MPVAVSSALPAAPLRTARLLLRPYEPADADVFYAVLAAHRDHLRPAFPARVAAVRALPDAARVLAGFRHDWQSGRLYVFGIWHQPTGTYLGDISLLPTRGATVSAEIGYYLAPAAEGRGYAREALAAAVTFGFNSLGAHRLDIRCRADNPRSCAVAEHCGFRQLPLRPRPWPLRGNGPTEIRHYAVYRPL